MHGDNVRHAVHPRELLVVIAGAEGVYCSRRCDWTLWGFLPPGVPKVRLIPVCRILPVAEGVRLLL